MNVSSTLQLLHRRINEIRVENADTKRFVPENELDNVMTRDVVAKLVGDFTPFDRTEEVVDFIIKGARKVFGILILINHVGGIHHFIHRDQLQTRRTDDLLPLPKAAIQEILNDNYLADLFHEKQWEFCAPVFSGRMIPRTFERQTILPYLADGFLSAGAFGSVHRIEIHPSHRPDGLCATSGFVRKELELDDTTYENEARVLSALQRLKHPNILKLIACYTFNAKHNLISPYIVGGTLQRFLEQERVPALSREEMFYSISGLASAIWALHEFAIGETGPSHKGHHQDLQPNNILVEGDRFILADFGLSSIKSMGDITRTPFKGRKGYCQAPECANLASPFQEHETTRLTDIFALGCIIADLLVYQVKGPSGVEKFRKDRVFHMPPMCYYLYHKGESSNNAVAASLEKIAEEDGSKSMRCIVQLVSRMLEILPSRRPAAAEVTANLYIITISAFVEYFTTLFAQFGACPDALIEEARFQSWVCSLDAEFYMGSSGATNTGRTFDFTVDILRQMKKALDAIDKNTPDLDCRSFLEVRILNTELLNMLSTERGSGARSRLDSILLGNIGPEKTDAVYNTLRSVFGDSRITGLVEAKHMVARVENGTKSLENPSFNIVTGLVVHVRGLGKHKVAKVRFDDHSKSRLVIVETIQYQDQLRRQKLLPRIFSLCDLLSGKTFQHQLRTPPFYGLHDNVDSFCFELLYDFPKTHEVGVGGQIPITLHELLTEQDRSNFPSLEIRLKLALDLAESLAAFHDVNWYHKDLTSYSVLFFPSQTAATTRASQPYLIGFQHSRNASDDFTEGPLQDRNHHRYHHPKYISMENRQFTGFRPQFDYYSLGILLVEIGFWATIDTIMNEHANEDNYTFSTTIIKQKLPILSFSMGSKYVNIVEQCLVDLGKKSSSLESGSALKTPGNLYFKQTVVIPLRSFGKCYLPQEPGRKRKREEKEQTPFLRQRRKKGQ